MNRKYGHRGYMDSDGDDRERSKPPPRKSLTTEELIHRKGLRHAIDRDARAVLRCHSCGRNVQDIGAITTDTVCPNCAAPLRCCRACRHFDSAARWQCRAQITEQVGDKNKPNQCRQYEARMVLDATGRRTSSAAGSNDAKSEFENLFKR